MCGVSVMEYEDIPEHRILEASIIIHAKRGARRGKFESVTPIVNVDPFYEM